MVVLDCNLGRPGPEVHIKYSLCDSPTDTYTHVDLNTLSDWFFWGLICLMAQSAFWEAQWLGFWGGDSWPTFRAEAHKHLRKQIPHLQAFLLPSSVTISNAHHLCTYEDCILLPECVEWPSTLCGSQLGPPSDIGSQPSKPWCLLRSFLFVTPSQMHWQWPRPEFSGA